MAKEKKFSPRKTKKSISSSSESGGSSAESGSRSSKSSSGSSDEAPAVSRSPSKHERTSNNNRDLTVHLRNAEMVSMYRNKNPHVKIEKSKLPSAFTPDQLSDDDEVWIFEVPASIDIEKLAGQTLKLGSRNSTIKLDDDNTIQCVSRTLENSRLSSLVCQTKTGGLSVKAVRTVGHVQLRKSLNESAEVAIDYKSAKANVKVPFPEDLKVRHPLHGVKFKKTINCSPSVMSRLEEAQEASIRPRSAGKPIKIEDSEPKMEISSPKKTKKRKADRSVDVEERHTNITKRVKVEENTVDAADNDLDWIKAI